MMFSTKFFMFPASNLKAEDRAPKKKKGNKIKTHTYKLPRTFTLNFISIEESNKLEKLSDDCSIKEILFLSS